MIKITLAKLGFPISCTSKGIVYFYVSVSGTYWSCHKDVFPSICRMYWQGLVTIPPVYYQNRFQAKQLKKAPRLYENEIYRLEKDGW